MGPPGIVIEIVSAVQRVNVLVRTCHWCVSHGVTLGLFGDPSDQSALAFLPARSAVPWQGSDRIDLSSILPRFGLTVDDLFATLRRT